MGGKRKEAGPKYSNVKSINRLDPYEFAKRLWGNAYYDADNREFKKSPLYLEQPRSFVEFVLEPLYKIYSHILAHDVPSLKTMAKELRIKLKNSDYKLDTKELIILVMRQWLHRTNISGFVDMCILHIPSPVENAKQKILQYYRGGPIYTDGDNDDDDDDNNNDHKDQVLTLSETKISSRTET